MKLKIDLDTESEKVIDSIQISLKYLDGTVDKVEKKVVTMPILNNSTAKTSETLPVQATESQTAIQTNPSTPIFEEQKPPTGTFGEVY